ncbi:MAG: DUF4932 domain-containing protein [Elusimicrobia bacterium]|nr:DUF4932 domain-containing protein [Elusimicrobiota bacterium]
MHLSFSRARAVLVFTLAAVSAASAAPASFTLSVDPRFELLAVVRQLSGEGKADAAASAYRERIEKRFGAFRGHPAVALYRDLAAAPSREEAVATIPLYLTDPPELALKDPDADVHYLNGPGEAEELQRFVAELRDLARASDFMAFFRGERAFHAGLEDSARRKLGTVDPVAAIEDYLGMSLASRSHYIIMPQRAATHAFIIPYPLPPANLGARSFEVYTMSPDIDAGGFARVVWPEPLFVFIDPAFHYFERLNVPVPADFYGPALARCRLASPDCVKHHAATALIARLNRKSGIAPAPAEELASAAAPEGRLVKALTQRLEEYEARRDLYPTLWHFLPRWFAVFEESAFPGRRPRRLAVPAEPRITSAADFFDPAVSARLLRADAR